MRESVQYLAMPLITVMLMVYEAQAHGSGFACESDHKPNITSASDRLSQSRNGQVIRMSDSQTAVCAFNWLERIVS